MSSILQPCGLAWTVVLVCLLNGSAEGASKQNLRSTLSAPVEYPGACGGSAAAAVGTQWFVMADDESNQLRVYARDQPGPPRQVIDLTASLELDRRFPETDIEGAARIGDRIYWISSHSRNHQGREHPNRQRFFATTVTETNGDPRISFVGRPDKDLLRDLTSAPGLQSLNLTAASQLAPKARGALNIEALCATPNGQLLIGFRNPIPGGNALLVPLENPQDVIEGKRAAFGSPIQLNLGGLGIRDMAYWQGEYLIIAGPYDGGGKSRLYHWSGGTTAPRHLKDVDLKGLNPEAIVIYPDTGFANVQLLSDDSGHQGALDCHDVTPSARHFRSLWISMTPKRSNKR